MMITQQVRGFLQHLFIISFPRYFYIVSILSLGARENFSQIYGYTVYNQTTLKWWTSATDGEFLGDARLCLQIVSSLSVLY